MTRTFALINKHKSWLSDGNQCRLVIGRRRVEILSWRITPPPPVLARLVTPPDVI